MSWSEDHKDLFQRLYNDRPLAHRVLFRHRHSSPSPAFHEEMINLWHSNTPENRNECFISFRGSAKSTIAEEAICIAAGFREFNYCLVAGASEDMAADRISAISRELTENEYLNDVFGNLKGSPWDAMSLTLADGRMIRGIGRGQRLRGTKGHIYRPDLIVVDDIEDDRHFVDDARRQDNSKWFLSVLLPAGDLPTLRVRVLSNDLHPECIARKLKAPGSGFVHRTYPIETIDHNGHRVPMWPDRFPLAAIDKERKKMYATGHAQEFEREYMCRSEAPSAKIFKKEMLKTEPHPFSWQPVFVIFDPARSKGASSADTGYVAASWIGNRIVVWEAWGRQLAPDQIVEAVFKANEARHPVAVGIDEVGLKEWLLQPIRQMQARTGTIIPLRPLAGRSSKDERIRGLFPYFAAGEVVFTTALPDLESQILSYSPTYRGKRDILDALSYMLWIRTGIPVYEDFSAANVMERYIDHSQTQAYIAMNASGTMLAASAIKAIDGRFFIVRDWLREGSPAELAGDLASELKLEYPEGFRIVLPEDHFAEHNRSGVLQALQRAGTSTIKGAAQTDGRDFIRESLRRQVRATPQFNVASTCRFTINAMSEGYATKPDFRGRVALNEAEDNQYRLLMEAVETTFSLMKYGSAVVDSAKANYEVNSSGQRYISSRVQRSAPAKTVWK